MVTHPSTVEQRVAQEGQPRSDVEDGADLDRVGHVVVEAAALDAGRDAARPVQRRDVDGKNDGHHQDPRQAQHQHQTLGQQPHHQLGTFVLHGRLLKTNKTFRYPLQEKVHWKFNQ